MEALAIIAVVILAIVLMLGLILLLLWAERGVNKSNKRYDDKWHEMEQERQKQEDLTKR